MLVEKQSIRLRDLSTPCPYSLHIPQKASNMFCKTLVIFAASVVVLVSAGKSSGRRDINNSCNAGPVQCCQ
ncbi:hypothetical protein CPB83DRAFT_853682 [Crepidotus variabilis]|uniref:Hydrophobin n=1 Tax=Crepidotus variabilis TaxID=179855 RepID=A0A9P6EHD5_9AGAR|nr:hypothetical protein CPB83DRAFT_853682 [Crepidotus variabilis]